MSDVTLTAESALTRALEFCAEEMDLGPQAVAYRIQKGNSIACTCYRCGLAKQIAEALGSWDKTDKAVYPLDYNVIPTDLSLSEVTQDIRRRLGGRKEVTSPVSGIDRLGEETVYLKLDKHAIESLSASPVG